MVSQFNGQRVRPAAAGDILWFVTRPRDPNQLAKLLVDIATGESDEPAEPDDREENRLGRSGGLVGGKARAESLSPEERSEIARKASRARWSKQPVPEE